MPPKHVDKGKEKRKTLPSHSLGRPDSPTLGLGAPSTRMHGKENDDFLYSEGDLALIKTRVALYRLSKMLQSEIEAESVVKKELTEFLDPEDEAAYGSNPEHPAILTTLVIRKAEVSFGLLEEKASHYNKLRATLVQLDEAYKKKDSLVLRSTMEKYDAPVQERYKREAKHPTKMWKLIKTYVLEVLIPNDWRFRAPPGMADYTAIDDDFTRAQLPQISEDDSEEVGQPEASHGERFQLDPDAEVQIRQSRGRDKDPRLGSDDDGTITETEEDRRKKEVHKTGSYYPKARDKEHREKRKWI